MMNTMKRLAVLALTVSFGAAACDRGPSPEVQQQLATLSAQKDSLVREVAQNARLMSEISSELSEVQIATGRLEVSAETPFRARRDTILAKIGYVTERLDDTEDRLVESRNRIRRLTQVNDSLRAMLDETIDNYEGIIEDQKATIATLTEQVNALTLENERLEREKAVLNAKVDTLTEDANRVYYVVGDKDELIERGIIEKEGGARFLFIFGKRGETLVPARDLDPSQFTAIDRTKVTEIPLPKPNEEYKIASRHDLGLVETANADAVIDVDDEKVKGADVLRIKDPERFWKTSRFLIIVRT